MIWIPKMFLFLPGELPPVYRGPPPLSEKKYVSAAMQGHGGAKQAAVTAFPGALAPLLAGPAGWPFSLCVV